MQLDPHKMGPDGVVLFPCFPWRLVGGGVWGGFISLKRFSGEGYVNLV